MSQKIQCHLKKIAEHEPTAVRRNSKDQQIVEGGQTGADTPEVRERFRKSEMAKF